MADGTGRVPAVEVLISTGMIRECILEPDKTKLIPDVLAKGKSQYGMQTFDQSLFDQYKAGKVSYEEALRWASNVEDFSTEFSIKDPNVIPNNQISGDLDLVRAPAKDDGVACGNGRTGTDRRRK